MNTERQFYALSTETFGEEFYVQISCGETILATVTTGETPNMFVVHNGMGLDDNDDQLPDNRAAKRFPIKGDGKEMATWREAVKFGYNHALSRMMLPDARQEVDSIDWKDVIHNLDDDDLDD